MNRIVPAMLGAVVASKFALVPTAGNVAGGHASRSFVPAAGGQSDEAFRNPMGPRRSRRNPRAYQGPGLSIDAARRQGGANAPQVRDGVVDVAWTLPGFTPGVMPKLEIFELPFLHRSTQRDGAALQEYVPKYMTKDFEPYHILLVHCHAGALFMTKDPINKVEDFQGMKLRSYSRTNASILEALGAAPLQVALPELAPMLSKGTVTGSILPYEIAPVGQDAGPHRLLHHAGAAAAAAQHRDLHLPDEQAEVREPAARPEEGDRRQLRRQPASISPSRRGTRSSSTARR